VIFVLGFGEGGAFCGRCGGRGNVTVALGWWYGIVICWWSLMYWLFVFLGDEQRDWCCVEWWLAGSLVS